MLQGKERDRRGGQGQIQLPCNEENAQVCGSSSAVGLGAQLPHRAMLHMMGNAEQGQGAEGATTSPGRQARGQWNILWQII